MSKLYTYSPNAFGKTPATTSTGVYMNTSYCENPRNVSIHKESFDKRSLIGWELDHIKSKFRYKSNDRYLSATVFRD